MEKKTQNPSPTQQPKPAAHLSFPRGPLFFRRPSSPVRFLLPLPFSRADPEKKPPGPARPHAPEPRLHPLAAQLPGPPRDPARAAARSAAPPLTGRTRPSSLTSRLPRATPGRVLAVISAPRQPLDPHAEAGLPFLNTPWPSPAPHLPTQPPSLTLARRHRSSRRAAVPLLRREHTSPLHHGPHKPPH